MKKQVKVSTEVKKLKEQLARALADYDNLSKRVEREKSEHEGLANIKLVLRFLSVYDMLEGAQKHIKDTGIAITMEEFIKAFKDEGIEKIEAKVGEKFNEEVHEVVEVDSSTTKGTEKGAKISKVILTGWKVVDGPVIRPVKVKVAKK